jgi:hypothetical protein
MSEPPDIVLSAHGGLDRWNIRESKHQNCVWRRSATDEGDQNRSGTSRRDRHHTSREHFNPPFWAGDSSPG